MQTEIALTDELAGEQYYAEHDRGADLPVLTEPFPCERCELAKACAVRLLSCEAFGRYVTGANEAAWRVAERLPTREAWEVLFRPGAKPRHACDARRTRKTAAPLTTASVVLALGVTRQTLGRWCREGAPRATVGRTGHGRSTVYNLGDLQAWLARHRPDFASRPKRDPGAAPFTPEQRRERHRQREQGRRDRQRAPARYQRPA